MNKQRRARLEKLRQGLTDLKDEAEAIQSEENDAFDNLPESLQGSPKGEKLQEAIYGLDALVEALESADDALAELENI